MLKEAHPQIGEIKDSVRKLVEKDAAVHAPDGATLS